MKKQFVIAISLLFAVIMQGQIDARAWLDDQYTQEWYTFDVVDKGMYRVTYQDFDTAEIDMSQIIAANLMLYRNGKEVPIYTSTSGLMGVNDFIEFFAYGEDGELDQYLYADTNHLPHKYSGLFHDTATYFLTWDNKTNHARIVDSVNILTNLPAAKNYCLRKNIAANNISFVSGDERTIGNTKYVLSDFERGEAFFSNPIYKTTSNFRTWTRGFVDGAADVTIEYQVAGLNDDKQVNVDHHFNLAIGNYEFDSVLTAYEYATFTGTLSTSDLSNSWTNISVTNLNDLSDDSRIGLGYYILTYPSDFNVRSSAAFEFYLSNETGNPFMEFSGVSHRGQSVYLYDLTNNIRMTTIINDNGLFQVKATQNKIEGERHMMLATENGMRRAINMKKVEIRNFDDVENQGDFIIIVDDDLLLEDPKFLDDYLTHRSISFEKPLVIGADELFNVFSYGKKLHPLSIVNLADEMARDWFYDVKYLFIIGQAVPYSNRSQYKTFCKVPSFGHHPSDMMLTAKIGSRIPQIPVGRLATISSQEASYYLDKVIDHEHRLNGYPNTKSGKSWMKQVIHLGGGKNESEQSEFANNLKEYENIIETSKYGGNVHTFLKESSDPIQTALSETFDTLVSNGVSLITFFGHSSANKLEFSIYNPENYENDGKYPLVISNGCLSGDIHRTGSSTAKNYVLLDQKGSIGFLASTYYSFASYDHVYSKSFYNRLSQTQYGEAIGDIMIGVIEEMVADDPNDDATIYSTQLITLHGDPSVKFNSSSLPDYVIEEDDVALIPSNISIDNDTFNVQVIITNLGLALPDSFNVRITRRFPDESSKIVHNGLYPSVYYKDTLNITLDIESENALGYNQLTIEVDPIDGNIFGMIDEIEDEVNNRIIKDLIILSDDIIPVYPYENQICNDNNLVLKASTVNLFAAVQSYIIQFDSVPEFNSGFMQEYTTSSVGGLIEWDIDDNLLEDDKVYFWRSSNDSAGNYNWFNTSFYYNKNEKNGWYQGHRGQYEKNNLANVLLNTGSNFAFVEDVKDLSLLTYNLLKKPTGFRGGDDIGWSVNGVRTGGSLRCFTDGTGNSNSGIVFAVFDSATFLAWSVQQGEYGSLNCSNGRSYTTINFRDYEYNDDAEGTGGAENQQNIAAFMDAIPDGQYVLSYLIAGEYTIPSDWEETLKTKFRDEGAQAIDTLGAGLPWAMFFKKGDPTYKVLEKVGDSSSALLRLDTTVQGAWNAGYMESEIIGPSYGWETLEFDHFSNDAGIYDEYSIDITAISAAGEAYEITNAVRSDTDISYISARDYPYLKLRWNVTDDSTRSPRQLDHWKVNYEQVPELAMAPNYQFAFNGDTLSEGDSIQLSIRLENLSKIDFDSLRTTFSIINHQNQLVKLDEYYIDSLKGNDSLTLQFSYNTLDMKNDNRLVVFANHGLDQSESESFNNIAIVPFFVKEDNSNPILDVSLQA